MILGLVRNWVCVAGVTATIAVAQPAGQASRLEMPVSAGALLHEAIGVLSTKALGHERVDWKAVEKELGATIQREGDGERAYAAIHAAVGRLGDSHARFTPATSPATPAAPSVTAAQPFVEQTGAPAAPAHAPIPTWPEGRMLADGAAYLVVPGCSAPTVGGLRDYARHAAAELKRLDATTPKAWVIDLRLNNGGNIWPMLLGLRPLLGDGVLMTMVRGETIESQFGVDEGASWIQWPGREARDVQLSWGGDGPDTIAPYKGRIAVLVGPWTMSSGESLAICFAGRENTRTFGEKTAGLTTVTNLFTLSDGSVLNLPVSRMGDRRGRAFSGSIEPMQTVAFEDWPDPDDTAARAARAWAIQK